MINMNDSYVYNEETEEVTFIDRPKEEIKDMSRMFDEMLWLGRHLALCNHWNKDPKAAPPKDILDKAMEQQTRIIKEYGDEPLFRKYMFYEEGKKDNWDELLGIVTALRWVLGSEWGDLDS